MMTATAIRRAGLGLVAAAVCVLAAACSSAPSGTENATGYTRGQAALATSTTFALTWSGPVATTGPFHGGTGQPAKGQHHTFSTKAGKLYAVITAKPVNSFKVTDTKTCAVLGSTVVKFKAAGGTGKWA